jgi:hypothetical protein
MKWYKLSWFPSMDKAIKSKVLCHMIWYWVQVSFFWKFCQKIPRYYLIGKTRPFASHHKIFGFINFNRSVRGDILNLTTMWEIFGFSCVWISAFDIIIDRVFTFFPWLHVLFIWSFVCVHIFRTGAHHGNSELDSLLNRIVWYIYEIRRETFVTLTWPKSNIFEYKMYLYCNMHT